MAITLKHLKELLNELDSTYDERIVMIHLDSTYGGAQALQSIDAGLSNEDIVLQDVLVVVRTEHVESVELRK